MPPGVAPEPILDVVRGLSTLASFGIVVGQLKNIYDAFFVGECERCRGTGLLTCPHCHGTKTLRKRPGYLRTRNYGIVDDARDQYECFYCGPPCLLDVDPMADEDDEQKAMQVQENLKFAVANIFPRPFDAAPTAGTVTCTSCLGNPKVHRLTPDFGKALNLGPLWDEVIAARMGQWYWGRDSRPADKRRLFLEYPSAPVRNPIEGPSPQPMSTEEAAQLRALEEERRKESAASVAGAFKAETRENLDDYVLQYASDDD